MNDRLFSLKEVSDMIEGGARLILAADEKVLSQLPAGDWIGGTTSIFMTADGGCQDEEHIFVTELPSYITATKRVQYNCGNIENIFCDGYDNGCTIIITPSMVPITLKFALEVTNFPQFAQKPIAGWVATTSIEKFSTARTAVFNGNGQAIYEDAVAIHLELPANKMAEVHAINMLTQSDLEEIEFLQDGFIADEVLINGQKASLPDYMDKMRAAGYFGLPLITNYSGTNINITGNMLPNHTYAFGGPFFKGIKYRIANKPGDYVEEFARFVESYQSSGEVIFSCNCLMNYLLGRLAGRKMAGFYGPFTGGEICYQLVNQTVVTIEIVDI